MTLSHVGRLGRVKFCLFKSESTDFSTNYCGLYYSDGKIQSSTSKGSRLPVDRLDSTCQVHDTSYALANGDIQLLNDADNIFFNANFGVDLRSSAYAVAVKYGNQINRTIFAIPFGIAALGYGLTASKLPPKFVSRSNDDNYSAFRPRTKKDFEDVKPQEPISGNLRGSVPDVVYQPKTENSTENCSDCRIQYNPYSTDKRRIRRNRRKRRGFIDY